MAAPKSPRKGSLQYWPRKRASKFLPRVNWENVNSLKNLKGFICYKAGMASAHVKDTTPNSMTKDKRIAIPVTILECPAMKIYSVRFYKHGKVLSEVISENFDKELKRKIRLPKKPGKKIDEVKNYDDLRVICYSEVKKTGIKKTPDLSEIGLSGDLDQKINFVKEHLKKDININDVFQKGQLTDLRGLTKGKGFCGPVKRFGITLRQHKSEKGVRKAGSIGPWHPTRVTFRVPMAGQMGMFTRVVENSKIIEIGKPNDKLTNIKNFGNIKTDYVLVYGSVQGPAKRQLLITATARESKQQTKKQFEFLELIR
jgi:large subunit ribosomal protein L3